MEILYLSLGRLPPGAVAGEQQEDRSDGSPRFLLIPATPLPKRRFLQGLGADFLLIGLVLASLLSERAVQEATVNPAQSYEKPIRITFYNPRPGKKRPPDASLTGVKGDEGRRFSPPLNTIQPIAAPVLGTPPKVETRADLISQILEKGIPLPPIPTQGILEARMGSPEAPAVPVPILDPSPRHAAAFPQHGPNLGADPLSSGESTARLFGDGSGTKGTGGRPPDLSAKPPRAAQGDQLQRQRETFTKPDISVMPKPMYPPAALAERIEGDVVLQVTFDKSGRVVFRHFIRQLENAEMNSVARETVERIKFVPAMRNGIPVDSDSVITVFFRLTQLNMTATF